MKWRGRVRTQLMNGGSGYLTGLKVALDVQHLYRPNHPRDQGSVYQLASGATITEAHCTLLYAAAIHGFLIAWGATVLSNDPVAKTLVGTYSQRNDAANLWGANLYLACHLHAGHGSYAAIEMMSARRDDRVACWIGNELVAAAPEILEYRTVSLAHLERGAVCIERCDCPALILEPFFGDNPRQQGL